MGKMKGGLGRPTPSTPGRARKHDPRTTRGHELSEVSPRSFVQGPCSDTCPLLLHSCKHDRGGFGTALMPLRGGLTSRTKKCVSQTKSSRSRPCKVVFPLCVGEDACFPLVYVSGCRSVGPRSLTP